MASTRVEIFDQPYSFGGGDEATVRRLADRVDAKMRQVARETKIVDSLRIAVLAAINLADENEALRARLEALEALEHNAQGTGRSLAARARALNRDLDQLLARAL